MAITLEDIMNKLDSFDEKFDNIDSVLDIIEDRYRIWNVCTTCKGLTYTIGYNLGPGGGPSEVQIPCPTCSQTGKLRVGQLENND